MASAVVGQLIARCASSRCAASWEELLARFGEAVEGGIGRALRRCGQRLPADSRQDLRQEVYCRLLEHDARVLRRCRGRREAEVACYLARVAERAVIDALRAAAAAKRGGGAWLEMAASESDAESVVCPAPSPERRAELAEARRRFLARCQQALGGGAGRRDLLVVYWAFCESWTSREICERLGGSLTPQAIDSLIYRFKRRLAALGLEVPRRPAGRR